MPTISDPSLIPDYPSPLSLWLNPANIKHIVRGSFMTISNRPQTVEHGEWIAHQVVENHRLLLNFVRIIHEKEDDGSVICTCQKMSAEKNHSYTFVISDSTELPGLELAKFSAHKYITLVQQWISDKINDTSVFLTNSSTTSYAFNPALNSGVSSDPEDWIGKQSGFPENFVHICRIIFRQMFYIYAHLYWEHFFEPFYHLGLEKELNSSFSHFLLTAIGLDMLKPHDLKPMQYLIDILAANGTLPPDSKAYEYANMENGMRLLHPNTLPQVN